MDNFKGAADKTALLWQPVGAKDRRFWWLLIRQSTHLILDCGSQRRREKGEGQKEKMMMKTIIISIIVKIKKKSKIKNEGDKGVNFLNKNYRLHCILFFYNLIILNKIRTHMKDRC